MELANLFCWSCQNTTQDICWGSTCVPEFWSYSSKWYSIATNLRASVSYSHTAIWYRLTWYCLPNVIGKSAGLDVGSRDSWQISRILLCSWKRSKYALCIVLTSKCIHGLRLLVHRIFPTHKSLEELCCIMFEVECMPLLVRLASRKRIMWLINWV